ncbi:hypothetical protein BGZ60DRAFT_489609 [Tricladium varicosporioides]|nr:hypothetical protein BGZ60DRAFT_489609 [Hymenoscyphus varicosporioides]
MKVAVIGGGPGGLVTLKYLTQAHKFLSTKPIEVRLFERGPEIGGTFRQRTYEDAEQVSSKYLTTFSDFRPSKEAPDFLPIVDYVVYLEEYCTRFDLWKYIELSTTVTKIRRRGVSGHTVSFVRANGTTEDWECEAVAICTGLHVTPNVPYVAGIENVPLVLHSSQFKARKQFGENTNVVVLGTGETGMDMAHLAVTSPTKTVTLCHRNGFLCAAKIIPNPVLFGRFRSSGPDIPTDVVTASLFESMYVHPIMKRSLIPWRYYDAFVKYTLWLVSGTKHGIDQWIGGLPDETYHTSELFFTKSSRAMPYISAPYRSRSLLHRIRSSIAQVQLPDTKGRVIDLAPWPSHIDANGIIHFTDNGRPEAHTMRNVRRKVDVLIFATGYDQTFPFLDKTYPRPEDADIRRIWKMRDETVGYIGFIRPSFGAIPPLAEFQAQLWVLALFQKLPHPLVKEEHYRLHISQDRRIQYGVDHENYAYQLATDMEAAPAASYMLTRGPKMFTTWALGANFNTKFRLIGPWAFKEAEEIMKNELWETITRRGGFFGIVVLSVIPISIFGPINFFTWLLVSMGLING